MTEKELKTIKECGKKLDSLFKGFNQKVCSDCPKAREGSKVGKDCYLTTKEAGCCSHCAKMLGYLQFWNNPNSQHYLEAKRLSKYFPRSINSRWHHFKLALKNFKAQFIILQAKYWFNNKYGFFNPKTHSCQLSREERSVICLRHCCIAWRVERARPIASRIRLIKIDNGLLF